MSAVADDPAGEAFLVVDQVSIGFGRGPVVRDAALSLAHGEIGCLLGPSGCGKSTLLRAIAGFEALDGGEIRMEGASLSTPTRVVKPEQRRIGMVFQDFSLFPHLSVADNVTFGIRSWSRDAQRRRTMELLDLVGLSGFGERYPHSMSGGEQQRVALARAMAPRPKLLLLDEPFSSLDVELREVLVPQVRVILLEERVTAILVTHDQMEAFAMADQIGVMAGGRIEQWDSGYRLYHQPATRFVADFVGQGEFVRARVIDDSSVDCALGVLRAPARHGHPPGAAVDILVRPDDLLHDDSSDLTAEVTRKVFRGSHFLYRVELPGGESLYCVANSHHDHAIGERIGVRLNLDHLVIFPAHAS